MNEQIKNFVKETLYEITRYEKETSKKFDPKEDIKSYVSDSAFPEYGFTMTDLNKVGVNPKSTFDTPLGVCFYPLDTRHYRDLISNHLPYASDKSHCTLVKFNNLNSKMWLKFDRANTSYASQEEVEKKLEDITLDWYYFQQARHSSRFGTSSDINVYLLAKYASNYQNYREAGKSYASILKKLGFIGVYDYSGQGLIHSNEKYQIIGLTNSSYTVIKSFNTSEIRKTQNDPADIISKKISSSSGAAPNTLRYVYDTYPHLRSSVAMHNNIPSDVVEKIIDSGDISLMLTAHKKIPYQELKKHFSHPVYGKMFKMHAFKKSDAKAEDVILAAKEMTKADDIYCILNFLKSKNICTSEDLDEIFVSLTEGYYKDKPKGVVDFYTELALRPEIKFSLIKKMLHTEMEIFSRGNFIESVLTKHKNFELLFSLFVYLEKIFRDPLAKKIVRHPDIEAFPRKLKTAISGYIKETLNILNRDKDTDHSVLIARLQRVLLSIGML
jgi:hypothetical protein